MLSTSQDPPKSYRNDDLPQDRRRALARGEMPDYAESAALFADYLMLSTARHGTEALFRRSMS